MVYDCQDKDVSAGVNSCTTVLSSPGGSSSGPHAYDEFNDECCFSTPVVLILRSSISENVDCPFNRSIHIYFIGKH